jgi:hypothetical protein
MHDRTKLNATEIGLLHMVDHAIDVQLERERELEETWPTRPRKELPRAHYLGSVGCTGPVKPRWKSG